MHMNVYSCIRMDVCVYVCVCVSNDERVPDHRRGIDWVLLRQHLHLVQYICIYIFVYICIYTCGCVCERDSNYERVTEAASLHGAMHMNVYIVVYVCMYVCVCVRERE